MNPWLITVNMKIQQWFPLPCELAPKAQLVEEAAFWLKGGGQPSEVLEAFFQDMMKRRNGGAPNGFGYFWIYLDPI